MCTPASRSLTLRFYQSACDENGELLSFSVFDAKRMKVLSMESAMEQLGMDIGW